MGRDLTGLTLEVIERPWKVDRFGGRRAVSEYLIDQVYFISIRTEAKKDEQNQ